MIASALRSGGAGTWAAPASGVAPTGAVMRSRRGIERYRKVAIRIHAPTAIEPRQACGRRCRSGQRARGGIDPIDGYALDRGVVVGVGRPSRGNRGGVDVLPRSALASADARRGRAGGAGGTAGTGATEIEATEPKRGSAAARSRQGSRSRQRITMARPRSRQVHDHGHDHGGVPVHVHVNDHGRDHVNDHANVGVAAPVADAVPVDGTATVGVAAPAHAAPINLNLTPNSLAALNPTAAFLAHLLYLARHLHASRHHRRLTARCTSAANLPSRSAATSPSRATCSTAG